MWMSACMQMGMHADNSIHARVNVNVSRIKLEYIIDGNWLFIT
jgi:hypothetical protein